jgi:hypothetical protein
VVQVSTFVFLRWPKLLPCLSLAHAPSTDGDVAKEPPSVVSKLCLSPRHRLLNFALFSIAHLHTSIASRQQAVAIPKRSESNISHFRQQLAPKLSIRRRKSNRDGALTPSHASLRNRRPAMVRTLPQPTYLPPTLSKLISSLSPKTIGSPPSSAPTFKTPSLSSGHHRPSPSQPPPPPTPQISSNATSPPTTRTPTSTSAPAPAAPRPPSNASSTTGSADAARRTSASS